MRAQRRLAVAGLVIGLGMLSGAASASASWTIQPTVSSEGDAMTGVSCGATKCMAVLGGGGFAESELWNGHRWSVRAVPNPAHGVGPYDDLAAVSCTSANACAAVGDYGHVSQELPLAERWNGRRWSVQHTPTRFLGSGGTGVLTGVSCKSGSSCTAVGSRAGTGPSHHSFLVAEGWNGRHWSPEPVPELAPVRGNSAAFTALSCSSANACTAVGNYGPFDHQSPLAERWNGHTWSMEQIRATPHTTSTLSSVSCPTATDCIAVGSRGHDTLTERWDGRRWSVQSTPNPGDARDGLGGISCSSAGACMAVGGSESRRGQALLAEHWNGRHWSIQRPPNAGSDGDSLDGVSCPSAGACTAVGQYFFQTTCNSTTCSVPTPLAERWTRR